MVQVVGTMQGAASKTMGAVRSAPQAPGLRPALVVALAATTLLGVELLVPEGVVGPNRPAPPGWGGGSTKYEYLVPFAELPDLSAAKNMPEGPARRKLVKHLIHEHFEAHSRKLETQLRQLKRERLIERYSAVPASNGFIVEVKAGNTNRFERRSRELRGIGEISRFPD